MPKKKTPASETVAAKERRIGVIPFLRTIYGAITAILVTLGALAGGATAVYSWASENIVFAGDFKPWQVRLLGVERTQAERQKSELKRDRFIILNDVELSKRKPTIYEQQRLEEIIEEMARVDKRIQDLNKAIEETRQ